MKKFYSLGVILLMAAVFFSCSTEKIASNNGYKYKHHDVQAAKKIESPKVSIAKDELVQPDLPVVQNSTEESLSIETSTNQTQQSANSLVQVFSTKKTIAKSNSDFKRVKQTINKTSNLLKAKAIYKKTSPNQKTDDIPLVLLYILCFVIPFLAVGFATDWDITAVIINILLTALCGIPGIIHALIVVNKNA